MKCGLESGWSGGSSLISSVSAMSVRVETVTRERSQPSPVTRLPGTESILGLRGIGVAGHRWIIRQEQKEIPCLPNETRSISYDAVPPLRPTSFWNSGSSCRQVRSGSLAAQFGLPYPTAKAFFSVSSASVFFARDAHPATTEFFQHAVVGNGAPNYRGGFRHCGRKFTSGHSCKQMLQVQLGNAAIVLVTSSVRNERVLARLPLLR